MTLESNENVWYPHNYGLLWSVQNTGSTPIRCILFHTASNTMIYGGYDKIVVLVDTERWVNIRELNVQGTVRQYSSLSFLAQIKKIPLHLEQLKSFFLML
jgi:hypothetical protein